MRHHPLFDWRLFVAILLIGALGGLWSEFQKPRDRVSPTASPTPSPVATESVQPSPENPDESQ